MLIFFRLKQIELLALEILNISKLHIIFNVEMNQISSDSSPWLTTNEFKEE
jgi:hypothetical protein